MVLIPSGLWVGVVPVAVIVSPVYAVASTVYISLYEGGLGQDLANGLISKLKEGTLWIGDKILGGLGAGLIGLTPVFAGACMIGVYLIIT